MKTYKRSPRVQRLTKEQRERLNNGHCPICGLPKSKWKRRIDWTCCSKECTSKYSDTFLDWQYWKLKVFQRDKYSCVKCGFKSRKEQIIHPDSEKYYKERGMLFKVISQERDELKVILGDESKLIGDHIIPIAIGGDEYDMNNVQTLCKDCNKIKTKEDMRIITLYKKRDPKQLDLNSQSITKSSLKNKTL